MNCFLTLLFIFGFLLFAVHADTRLIEFALDDQLEKIAVSGDGEETMFVERNTATLLSHQASNVWQFIQMKLTQRQIL